MPITTSIPLNYGQQEYFVITQLDETAKPESDTLHCNFPRDDATISESHKFKTKNTNTEIVENRKNQPVLQTKICKECHKVFPTTKSFNIHIKTHDNKRHLSCPLCPAKHKENLLITHILTHESDSCFPCQVCGVVYKSQDERLKHWKTHANEQPFDCKICYRRFTRKEYLTHHLKTHNQYRCNYCVCEFYTNAVLPEPYVCSKCEKISRLKQTTSLHDQTSIVYGTDKKTITVCNQAQQEFIGLSSTFNRNDEAFGSNSPRTFSPNEEFVNYDELSDEDGSDLELIAKTYDNVDGDVDDVPSGSVGKISPPVRVRLEGDSLTYICTHCKRSFTSQKSLARHIRGHMNNDC